MNINQQKILKLAMRKDISKMRLSDIAKETEIDHLFKVKYHLGKLKEKGLIYYDRNKKKQKVSQNKSFSIGSILSIPIVGSANCGPALELAQEDIQGYLRISKSLISEISSPEKLIVIRGVGESLNRAKIRGESVKDGDYLIVDCGRQPENGDYVLSIIDGAANFKRFFADKKKKEIHLISELTQDIPPIILGEEDINATDYLINGVVVKVVKRRH